jgi:hypothetical protein
MNCEFPDVKPHREPNMWLLRHGLDSEKRANNSFIFRHIEASLLAFWCNGMVGGATSAKCGQHLVAHGEIFVFRRRPLDAHTRKHVDVRRTKALPPDTPEQELIVALRTGNRRGTAICSRLQERRRLDFLLTRILPRNYEKFFAASSMSGKLTDAEWIGVCGTSFNLPK